LDTNVILPVQLEIKCSVGAVLDRDFAKAGKGRTMAEKIVLIVDDDEGIVRLVPPMIDREGLRSVAAYDGQEALHLYETLHPDLILLDLAMPVMNGLDVIEAIRRREQGGPRTPIVLLTAHGHSYFTGERPRADVDGYITKPVTLLKLRQEVLPLLAR